MYVLPAIDVLDGKAVRLFQGDYNKVTVYNEDVVDQARQWVDQGAQWIHIVDLDGARTGNPANIEAISRIAKTFDVQLEVGGGVRNLETARRLLDAGVTRVVLGTALATNIDLVKSMVDEFGPDALVAGIDAREGVVAIEGWRKGADTHASHLAGELRILGLRHLVFTDIDRDGTQMGIQAHVYNEVALMAGFPVIVSGGVSTLEDVEASRKLGPRVVEGVIIGRALYENNFTLAEAIETLAS